MIHRVGLFIASLAAAGVLVVALTVAGFAPGSGAVPGTAAATAGQSAAAAGVQPTPQVQVDTVYLGAPEAPKTITVHKVVPAAPGEGQEHESGDD